MNAQALIDSFLSGDMGDVEFLELALDAGMEFDAIEAVLAEAREDF